MWVSPENVLQPWQSWGSEVEYSASKCHLLHFSSEYPLSSYFRFNSSILDQCRRVDDSLSFPTEVTFWSAACVTWFSSGCGSSESKVLFCSDDEKHSLHIKARASTDARTVPRTIEAFCSLGTSRTPSASCSDCLFMDQTLSLWHLGSNCNFLTGIWYCYKIRLPSD